MELENIKVGHFYLLKEYHAMPEIMGRKVKVVSLVAPDMAHYPVAIVLEGEPVHVEQELPGGMKMEGDIIGPFQVRADELEELEEGEVPDAFKQAFDDKPEGGQAE